MKNIILKIIFSLNIYSLICSNCVDTEVEEKCLKKFGSDKYPDLCCYYKEVGEEGGNGAEGDHHCRAVPYSSYSQENTTDYIDGKLYTVQCPEGVSKDNFNLERCGNIYDENPSKKDCRKYSTYVDSCCYYSGKNKDDDPGNQGEEFKKGCYWLGSKYEGSIFWAGARLECSFQFLKYSLFTFLYLIILL